MLDFIATFTDPSSLPSARREWQSRERLRQVAYEEPWSHAVLRALAVLESTGQIGRRGDRWAIVPAPALTTGRHPATLGILTRAWTQVAIDALTD